MCRLGCQRLIRFSHLTSYRNYFVAACAARTTRSGACVSRTKAPTRWVTCRRIRRVVTVMIVSWQELAAVAARAMRSSAVAPE